MKKIEKFEDLLGETLAAVEYEKSGDDQVVFTLADGRRFAQLHYQDCCESVGVEEIVGDLSDLVGDVVVAEESSNTEDDGKYGDSTTWTFYRVGTNRGTVVIRWCGTSNGYYSESVDFVEVK